MARSYPHTHCPVAHALDQIGERWTILILRDLIRYPSRRFQDFESALHGIAPNTLSARLKALEDAGLVERRLYAERPARFEYVLSETGDGVRPVLKALFNWGRQLQEMESPSG